ncbi:DUF362 domain-containing protein [Candidatus Woesearchaeota archaeon]|nr:DUF362 domain-containing protein [Candidatus Woesearchaeota archaeon]
MSSVVVLKTGEREVEKNIKKMFILAGGADRFIKKGDKVLIKPNCLNSKPSSTGCTTDLRIIEAVVKIVLKQGAIPIIAEASPISFDTTHIFRQLGIKKLAEKYNARLVDMNKYAFIKVKVENPVVLKKVAVSKLVFETDKIINLPVMKTHVLTTVSLGMKNLMGCVSGEQKLRLHEVGVCEGVVDICQIIKPAFTIIDGIIAMEGAGPSNGKPKRMNLLVGSDDVLAADIVACQIMGFNPHSMKFVKSAANHDIGEYELGKIKIIGASLSRVKSRFSFPRLNISRIAGTVLLKSFIPLIRASGIDVNKLAKRISESMRPHPEFLDNCKRCKRCVVNCPEKALVLDQHHHAKPKLDKKKCIKCYVCDEVCLYGAVKIKGSR